MVNIASIGCFDSFRFSYIFDNSEQFHNIKKIIYDYSKQKREKISDYEKILTFFMYQGTTDSDEYSIFIDKISFFEGIIILIKTTEGKKFGIYHRGLITPNEKNSFDSDCKDVFLFTFDNNKIYYFKGGKYSIHFNNKHFLSLGDDELIIYNNYFNNGGYIDFPLKSFYFPSISNNILTNKNGKFGVKNIEVYCFFG